MRGIEVRNISKTYNKKNMALDDVSVCFEYGKIYGLLGRNGAGKSTLINLICNRIFPTSGEIFVDGDPVRENDKALSKIFTMSENNLLPPNMKFNKAMNLCKIFYPDTDLDYAAKLAEKFGLDTGKKLGSFSTGYKSISKIVMALSCNADYVFFDEPVLGLDPNHRDLFYKEMIERYSETGNTFVISTHLIDECANLIEKAVIIKNGRLIANEETEQILSTAFTVTGPVALVDKFIEGKKVLGMDTIGGIKSAYIMGKAENVPAGLEVSSASLQSLFIQLTN
jgi:ABC-2 type transport system ATP-binding protein